MFFKQPNLSNNTLILVIFVETWTIFNQKKIYKHFKFSENPIKMKLQQLTHESENELRAKIKELDPWFHNIELAKGVFTNESPDYPQRRWKVIAPYVIGNVKNKNCLDIGCSSGFFSIKLWENEARKVVGIDHGEQGSAIKQAEFVKNQFQADNIEFKEMSVYDVDKLDQKFDFTLFLGVMYHLRYPLLALDKLRGVTDKLIIQTITTKIESPIIKNNDYINNPEITENVVLASEQLYQPGHPKWYFIEKSLNDDDSNMWVPNVEGVLSALRNSGFKIEKMLLDINEVTLVCS